ncbi:meprin A subunit beta-like [Coregonus clupeaformis]|uniref:meprin A subunit beta-like n=1 Tax=Coregonus clupeaformis TaxID=59861 RepID=UPI001E1C3170|nr:meprin A subunit beta-like [Coregonus clupeaformis]
MVSLEGNFPLSPPGNEFYWDNPCKVGSLVNGSDGSQFYRGPGTGTSSYLTHGRMKSRNFIKGDDAIFFLGLEDVSALLETQPLPRSAVHQSEKSAVVSPSQETTNTSTVVMAVSMSLTAVMFVVAMASVVYARRSESDVIVVENIDI